MSAAQWVWLVILLCSFNVVQAADIARDVRAGREDETLLFDGYLEFSASASRVQIPIDGVDDYIGKFGVGGHIIEKLVDCAVCILSGCGLLGANLAEGNQYFVVDGSAVV